MSASAKRQRPRVICHMMGTLDGRIIVDGWPRSEAMERHYEDVHETFAADGWMCGRVTMEEFADGTRPEDEVRRQRAGGPRRDDHVVSGDHDGYAIAMDPSGKLLWKSGDLDGEHVVAVLTHRVSDDYLATLREAGVSYVLAGDDDLDLALALEKIGARFGVKTLMLEGGGHINGGMMQAGLVDEVSLLLIPVADGRSDAPTVFEAGEDATPRALALDSVERREGGVVWLRYSVQPSGS